MLLLMKTSSKTAQVIFQHSLAKHPVLHKIQQSLIGCNTHHFLAIYENPKGAWVVLFIILEHIEIGQILALCDSATADLTADLTGFFPLVDFRSLNNPTAAFALCFDQR